MGASLNTGNRGVSALCASFVKIVKHIEPNADITLFTGARDSTPQTLRLSDREVMLRVVNHRMSPRSRLSQHLLVIFSLAFLQKCIVIPALRQKIISSNTFLREMQECDFFGEIRGGDSFSDIYGLKRFLLGSLTSIIALLLGKRLVLLPQTYGPYDSRMARTVAKYILRRSAVVLSRYRDGVSAIKQMLGSNSNVSVRFCPDVAFMLDALKPEAPQIIPPLQQDAMRLLIGININGLMYNGGYTQGNMFGLQFDYKEMALKMMLELLEQTNANLLLIPHTFGLSGNINSDPDASRDVINSLPKEYKTRVHMVMNEYDQSEIKGVIGMCDFFIGSRMHACIAALSQGIPTVGIAYSHKFIGVFDSIGSGETVIDGRALDIDAVIRNVMTAFENRKALSAEIKETIAVAQQKIMATFKEVLK